MLLFFMLLTIMQKTIKASVKEAKGEKEYTGLQTIIDAYTKSASKGIETKST